MSKETKKVSKKARILKMLGEGKSVGEIAKAIKVKPGYVYYIRWMDLNKQGAKAQKAKKVKKSKHPSKLMRAVHQMNAELDALVKNPSKAKRLRDRELSPVRARDLMMVTGIDVVNNPPHYKTGGIDTLDFIEAKDLNFRLANVVKYVVRCGKKTNSDPIQDLEKAAFYLKREIEARKGA